MIIRFFQPLRGSAAEFLWQEGEASYVLAGRAERAEVSEAPLDLVAWCAELEGILVGIQAARLAPRDEPPGIAHGALSWVRPGFRRRGVFSAIQEAVDAGLAERGFSFIRSWVVEGPDEIAMCAAIEARGGTRVGDRSRVIGGKPVRYTEFLRQLVTA